MLRRIIVLCLGVLLVLAGCGQPAATSDVRLSPTATGDPVLINEALVSHSGTDDTEFVELYGTPGTSLEGLSVIVVESDAGSSSGHIDRRFDLPAGSTLGDNGFFLIGNPAGLEADYGVTPDLAIGANSLENSSLTLALVSTASLSGEVVTGGESVLDAVGVNDGGDGDQFFFDAPVIGPDGTFFPAGVRRVQDGVDNDTTADWVIADFGLGSDNTPTSGGGEGGSEPQPDEVLIHEIQGDGDESPLDGEFVSITGVVVGDFQASGELNGFFVQEEDAEADDNPLTSEGIFVFESGSDVEVSVGDLVTVTGEVDEFNGLTELTDVTEVAVLQTDVSLPEATEIELPLESTGALEVYEGMYVTFPQALVISEYFNYERFGELVLALPNPDDQARQYQPTSFVEPGDAAQAEAIDNALRRITLDDGSTDQNPDTVPHPNGEAFALDNRFRGGDTVSGATGVLHYGFGLYRLQPTEGATYTVQNPRPEAPDETGGSLEVASFNVLNYFTTLDEGEEICGPTGGLECRGADTEEEFTRQRDKIIAALAEIDADVVGLIEIENHPDDAALADLVNGLNDATGDGTYAYIATGPIGTDAIRVALIYKPAAVVPLGEPAILDSGVDERFIDDKNRPVLAQTFGERATGGVFTVAVNHLKSKGSDCEDVGDPDTGDGQGNCNVTRTEAAEALVDWLASDPTGSGDADALIIGDLNAYDEEDPIDAIRAGADDALGTEDDYLDLVEEFGGEFAYSYVFDGQAGYLDHALANGPLSPEVTGATVWHINADEPDILDYDMSFKPDAQDALYEPDPYRSSDHDPVIVGLEPQLEAASGARFLAGLVEELLLNRGQKRSLQAKLEQAQKQFEQGSETPADNALGAFVNEVEALVRGGVMDAAAGDSLIAWAQTLINDF